MKTSRPLRVLEVGKFYPPHRGGMESHVKSLCDALRDRIELTVLVANNSRSTIKSVVDGVPVVRVGTIGKIASAPISPALPYFMRNIPADVIHIHMPHPAAVPSYFAAASGTPLVITYHSDIVRQRLLGKMFVPILEQSLRRASIICTSQQYLDSSPHLQSHRTRCQIIPLSVDREEFQTPDPALVTQIKERYGDRILLAVGRLVYYKGYEYLIRCMRNVPGHLLIVGEGPLREGLERIASHSGVADRVTFLGQLNDLSPYYQAADVFVLPSIERSEAFGIVQLEAMAHSKPVVNTRLDTGVPFVSVDGLTGFTVAPANSSALAGALNVLLDQPELRMRLGKAARHRALTEFTVPMMADATLRVLEDAATGKLPLRATAQSARQGREVMP